MSALQASKAVLVGTAVIGISMAQMILTGVCLAVGFAVGGIIVDKVKKSIEDADLARQEKKHEEPSGDPVVQE